MKTLVVVGHGMVGHKLVASLLEMGGDRAWDIVVIGEEPHPAYDRVHLSSLFEGSEPEDLHLGEHPHVTVYADDRVTVIDRQARTVTSAQGRTLSFDAVVLATGSSPFVPPTPGRNRPGCFVYRTVDDVAAIQEAARVARHGFVVGGGLLGLEAANALSSSGLVTEVVEMAPWLMPQQIDEVGGAVLRARIEDLGLAVHPATTIAEIHAGTSGRVAAVDLSAADGVGEPVRVATDMVVFSAGIRPRDDLARAAGLVVGERGGIVVDEQCRTSDPRIFAIGECASVDGQVYGLVGPGYEMAKTVAAVLAGGTGSFTSADLSTKLKLLGVDVASFGDAKGVGPGTSTIVFTDVPKRVHRRLVVDGAGRIQGGVLVGDATGYEILAQMAAGTIDSPSDVAGLVSPEGVGTGAAVGPESWPDTAQVCSCEAVTKGAICAAVRAGLDDGAAGVATVKKATKAGTGCGGCVPLIDDIVRAELAAAGVATTDDLCEHFAYSRQQLWDIVAIEGIETFSELLSDHGRGRGCEVCKPAVASILASAHNRYILDTDQAHLQDTNDHHLANLQKDGTYSVVPRVPGGEISPEKLIVLGEVARDFDLYTKITGGQRIDLLGARVDQLPAIWTRLVDAGFESGHAYGKAMRTVKSCVGTNWCRYGVQDSTGMAIALELRYRGLRSPHKLKLGVSGCSRECAEAQGKDVGVIATEKGWNLHVGGNGGTTPRRADLLLAEIDDDTLVTTIDRYLMYYIRTAKRLQRTAPWQERFPGGLDELRRVIVDDHLGICADLDAAMARHVATYRCEWKATIEDPDKLRRFRTFINSDAPDGDIVMVAERDQHRPAAEWEKVSLLGVPT